MRILVFIVVGCFGFALAAYSQTPGDGLMMSKNSFCQVLSYSQNSWTNYWEGNLQRSNSNLGGFRSDMAVLMGAYGLSDDLNVIYSLPYISTRFTGSYLDGYSGFQDLSLWLKYSAYAADAGDLGTLSFFGTVGGSVPTHDYVVNQLPLSIGFGVPSASMRFVADLTADNGFYATAQAGYTFRGDLTIDEQAYFYDGKLYYTNSVPVPNAFDATLRIGYIVSEFQADVYLDRFSCVSGDDMRYNSMPTPSVMMQSTALGLYGRYNLNQFSIMANASRVVAGRNFGQTLALNIAVGYIFNFASGLGDDDKIEQNPKIH